MTAKTVIAAKVATAHIPGSDLTILQEKTTAKLRECRPMCIPGTNAIISSTEAEIWHDLVIKAAIELNVNPVQIQAFCDLAGVAD